MKGLDGRNIETTPSLPTLIQRSQVQPSFFLEFQVPIHLHKLRQVWPIDENIVLTNKIVVFLL